MRFLFLFFVMASARSIRRRRLSVLILLLEGFGPGKVNYQSFGTASYDHSPKLMTRSDGYIRGTTRRFPREIRRDILP